MLVELRQLAHVIGSDGINPRDLTNVGPYVRQIFGVKADAIYLDVGQGWCEIISVNPKSEPFEIILREVIDVSELEGGV
jgi:hypothetical protein